MLYLRMDRTNSFIYKLNRLLGLQFGGSSFKDLVGNSLFGISDTSRGPIDLAHPSQEPFELTFGALSEYAAKNRSRLCLVIDDANMIDPDILSQLFNRANIQVTETYGYNFIFIFYDGSVYADYQGQSDIPRMDSLYFQESNRDEIYNYLRASGVGSSDDIGSEDDVINFIYDLCGGNLLSLNKSIAYFESAGNHTSEGLKNHLLQSFATKTPLSLPTDNKQFEKNWGNRPDHLKEAILYFWQCIEFMLAKDVIYYEDFKLGLGEHIQEVLASNLISVVADLEHDGMYICFQNKLSEIWLQRLLQKYSTSLERAKEYEGKQNSDN